MTEETNDPYAPVIAAGFVANQVSRAGVFAICAKLIHKGIFEPRDVAFVFRHMREQISERNGEIVLEHIEAHLKKSEEALLDLFNSATTTAD